MAGASQSVRGVRIPSASYLVFSLWKWTCKMKNKKLAAGASRPLLDLGFRFLKGRQKCCCGHKASKHGGSPVHFYARMRCQARSCGCLRMKTCAPWHRHVVGRVRYAIMKEVFDQAVEKIRKLAYTRSKKSSRGAARPK